MSHWRDNLVTERDAIAPLVRACRRIAVLGIKTEAQRGQAAFYVPRHMARAGCDIAPVPLRCDSREAREIRGRPVFRALRAVPAPVDMVNVSRRSEHIPPHVPD